jgi:hypothetical protein
MKRAWSIVKAILKRDVKGSNQPLNMLENVGYEIDPIVHAMISRQAGVL